MKQTILTSELNRFNLLMVQEEAVVRNYKKINAFFTVHFADYPVGVREILAVPEFKGGKNDEVIHWNTELFNSKPVKLSSLEGEEKAKYRALLDKELDYIGSLIRDLPSEVCRLLHTSVTYYSEETIYCADNKLVITEWGMHPKENAKYFSIDLSAVSGLKLNGPIEDPDLVDIVAPVTNIVKEEKPVDTKPDVGFSGFAGMDFVPPVPNSQPDRMPDSAYDKTVDSAYVPPIQETPKEETIPVEPVREQPVEEATPVEPVQETMVEEVTPSEGLTPEEPVEVQPVEPVPAEDLGNGNDTINKDDGKKRKFPWWLLLLLLLLIAGVLLLLRTCKHDPKGVDTPEQPIEDVRRPAPAVQSGDIEQIGDPKSQRSIVGNRLVLMIDEDMSLEEFVKDFRKEYPDIDVYQLCDFNDFLNRITLVLPSEEREAMKDRLPEEFFDYGLRVLYEDVILSNKTFNDPAFSDEELSWYFDMIEVADAWNVTTGSPDVIVAVIDDGFDLDHPELKAKNIVKPYNAAQRNSNIYPEDDSGHGTHVSGTAIGIANNREGTAGIAPDCSYMPIKVADENGYMYSTTIQNAAQYAIQQGANVVNMSLGAQINPLIALLPVDEQKKIVETSFKDEEELWRRIYSKAIKQDVTFVLAGGNDNILIDIDPKKRMEGTVRVSAVTPDKYKADFSNFGDASDLSAPGVDIFNAVSGEESYSFMDGTSMASPIVAGTYALIKSYDLSLTTQQITEILQKTGVESPSGNVGKIINLGNAMRYLTGRHDGGGTDPGYGGGGGTDPGYGGGRGTDPGYGGGRGTDPGYGGGGGTDPGYGGGRGTDPGYGGGGGTDPGYGGGGGTDPGYGGGRGTDPGYGGGRGTDPGYGGGRGTDPGYYRWWDKKPDPCPDCTEKERREREIMRMIEDLMKELEELRKKYPDCGSSSASSPLYPY